MFACNNDNSKKEGTDSTSTSADKVSSESPEKTESRNSESAKYELAEGIIEYEMNIIITTVKMTTYFKNHGEIQASVMEANIMGQKSVERELHKDGVFYKLDMLKKTGDKIVMDGEIPADFDPMKFNFANISDEIKEKYHIKEVGKEEFLGKECTIYTTEAPEGTSKMWIWKNIPLKMKVNAQGMEMDLLTAKKIDENPTFPEGIFEIPADFTITEIKAEDIINEK